MKKAALHNLGCKVNSYETEAMKAQLMKGGYRIVDFTEPADVYVVNTCSVTNMADKKSRQALHKAKKLNPDSIVVAVGCYAQTAGQELLRDDDVDIILGTDQKGALLERIGEFGRTGEKISCVAEPGRGRAYEELEGGTTLERTRAVVKIQDGCDQFCSYCIIPYTRGRCRSRDMGSILKEAGRLADEGYKEIVLTGIHISSYGKEHGESRLWALLEQLAAVEGIDRIRLGSLEPGIMTEEFVKNLRGLSRLCPHFHLSLQSGCDATLRRMNRRYTAREYLEKCDLLRSYFEHPAITTDIITGFPGETEAEFEQTCRFVEEAEFFKIHVFPYSRRKGTKAAAMDCQVERAIKAERSRRMAAIGGKLYSNFLSWHLGRELEILTERAEVIDGQRCLVGHTKEYVECACGAEGFDVNELVRGRGEKILKNHYIFIK